MKARTEDFALGLLMGTFDDILLVTTLLGAVCSAEVCDVLLPDHYTGSQPPIPKDGTPLDIDIGLFVEDLLEINDAEMYFKMSIK